MAARALGRNDGEFNEDRVSAGEDEKILEMMVMVTQQCECA